MKGFDLRLDLKGTVGLLILGAILVCAIGAPWIAPRDPNAQDLLNTIAAPSWIAGGKVGHLLGTDRLGQDILSRIVYGSRVSLVIAFAAVTGSAVLGTVMGLFAGFFGRIVENVIMRLVDIVLAVPFILLALVLMSVLGSSFVNLVVAFVAARWVQYARIAYAQTLDIKQRDFILACRASGISQMDILFRHVLPNILGPLLVVATLELGFVILMESGLSFLGLGAPPEVPSWGGMLQEGRALINIAWWLTTFPGLAIALTVMGFNFVGDWLRDRLDPRVGAGR